MTRFIFNVDDVGLTEGHTQAVERALDCGVIDRVSLLANGPAFAGAAAFLRRQPCVGAGVHLTLYMGVPVLPAFEVRELVDQAGRFPSQLAAPLSVWLARPHVLEAVKREWRAQIQRVRDAGLAVSHVDSHRHVHAWPPLCDLVIELAIEAQIPYVRAPRPALSASSLTRHGARLLALYPFGERAFRRIRAAGLDCADHFLGFDASGAMTGAKLAAEMRAAPPGTVEVMMHPAVRSPDLVTLSASWRWLRKYRFEDELNALCDPEVVATAAADRNATP
jgi:predicted glycoside hydrolase/deacetylase ChbG (UPF0249 family)